MTKVVDAVPVVNLENYPTMLERHKNYLLSRKGDDKLMVELLWRKLLSDLYKRFRTDVNVILSSAINDKGMLMFVNIDLAKRFCEDMIKVDSLRESENLASPYEMLSFNDAFESAMK